MQKPWGIHGLDIKFQSSRNDPEDPWHVESDRFGEECMCILFSCGSGVCGTQVKMTVACGGELVGPSQLFSTCVSTQLYSSVSTLWGDYMHWWNQEIWECLKMHCFWKSMVFCKVTFFFFNAKTCSGLTDPQWYDMESGDVGWEFINYIFSIR